MGVSLERVVQACIMGLRPGLGCGAEGLRLEVGIFGFRVWGLIFKKHRGSGLAVEVEDSGLTSQTS